MRNKLVFFIFLMLLGNMNLEAQQALWGAPGIVSPEVKEDKTVTFRFQAPDAKEVKISGDWMPAQGWIPGSEVMTKDDKGIWSYTSAALASDLYSYSFNVDGVKTTDPNNVYVIRDVATVSNVFLVGGGKGDLYKVNAVPHGTVARRWYDSPGNSMTRRLTIYTPVSYTHLTLPTNREV